MKDADLVAYVERVESYFFRWKRRPGSLSPQDFARARRWFEEGVPVEAVLEGITLAFQAHGAGRDGETEEVNSLGFCQPFVEQVLRRKH
ncbi:MAG: hypothetical protein ACE5JI_10820 [Acidobacteriota bacterium]